jgi:ATP-dependent Clp protease ATP-binding subunit ClpA
MFDGFTEKATKAVMLAQEEARRLGHNFIDPDQIFLGLLGEGTGVAAKVLKSIGVNLKDARIAVEKMIGRGSGFVAVEIPFTPRSKRVLEYSLEEARQLESNYISTEHLLLGLIREGEKVGVRVFEHLGVDLSQVRTQVIRMLNETPKFIAGSSSAPAHIPSLHLFTAEAIKVIMLAQEEARHLGHNYVGTEQILLGLIAEETGIAAKVLKSMGVNLNDARIAVEKVIGKGSGFVAVEIPFTPHTKRVLQRSFIKASQLGHSYISTEHLLLALIRESEGITAIVFKNFGVGLSSIRAQVILMLNATHVVSSGGNQELSQSLLPMRQQRWVQDSRYLSTYHPRKRIDKK